MAWQPNAETLVSINREIKRFEAWLIKQPEGSAPVFDEYGFETCEKEAIALAKPEEAILRSFLLWQTWQLHEALSHNMAARKEACDGKA